MSLGCMYMGYGGYYYPELSRNIYFSLSIHSSHFHSLSLLFPYFFTKYSDSTCLVSSLCAFITADLIMRFGSSLWETMAIEPAQ